MANGRFVSYLRVSTQRQGQSGLGIKAQHEAVARYLNGGNWELMAEVVEVESGKKNDLPKLAEAIATCRAYGATLVIARLDRLSRDASFLLSLRDAGIEFVVADNPHANRLTVGVLALVAENEGAAISARTNVALAAAKARGQQLGAYRDGIFVGRTGTAENAATARAGRSAKAQTKADNLRFLIERIDPQRTMSLRTLAAALNAERVPTVSGRGLWAAQTVKLVLERLTNASEGASRCQAKYYRAV